MKETARLSTEDIPVKIKFDESAASNQAKTVPKEMPWGK
jgi:hypothetical protein